MRCSRIAGSNSAASIIRSKTRFAVSRRARCRTKPKCCSQPSIEPERCRKTVNREKRMSLADSKDDFVEEVELYGHIIDSLLLPKILDEILTQGGNYVIKDIQIGRRMNDPSHARLEVRAESAETLEKILDAIHDHGAVATNVVDCQAVAADVAGTFPEGFYSTTNFRTQVRLAGEWVDVEDQEMDCSILIDPEGKAARCVPMTSVRLDDRIVVGRQGLRVFP